MHSETNRESYFASGAICFWGGVLSATLLMLAVAWIACEPERMSIGGMTRLLLSLALAPLVIVPLTAGAIDVTSRGTYEKISAALTPRKVCLYSAGLSVAFMIAMLTTVAAFGVDALIIGDAEVDIRITISLAVTAWLLSVAASVRLCALLVILSCSR